MLRLALESDEDRVLQLAMNFFHAANLPYGGVSEDKARTTIQNCTSHLIKESVLICWEEDGELQGCLAGQLTEVMFNYNLVATEFMWWIEPAYRKGEAASKMLGAFEYWAEFNGCKYVQMAGIQNDYSKALERYYKRNGYVNAENTYVKEIGR